jgi:beta-phosphoglucomutase-like phosphatase (HAD superfamily)
MKTIIFDIDGTITDMWPIERAVLLEMTNKSLGDWFEKLKSEGISETYKLFCKISKKKISKASYVNLYNKAFAILLQNKKLPKPKKYPIVGWILKNKSYYKFVYITGGQKAETEYVLKSLGIRDCFDLASSLNRSNCRFSKITGIPFNKMKVKFKKCILISDSVADCVGAMRSKVPYIKIKNSHEF